MARGGYISVQVSIDKVLKAVRSRHDARRIICDNLRAGIVAARGRKSTEREREIKTPMVLRDLGSLLPDRMLDHQTDIPKTFWKKANFSDFVNSNSEHAEFFDDKSDSITMYVDVKFKETDINALIKKEQWLSASPAQTEKKPRARKAGWEDWVAALATLAHEQAFDGRTDRNELLGLITARLTKLGLEERPISTVGPTAAAVLLRFKLTPPATPLVANGKLPTKP